MGDNFEIFLQTLLRRQQDPQQMRLYTAEDTVFYNDADENELRSMRPEITRDEAMRLWHEVHDSDIARKLWPAFVALPLPPIHFRKIGEPMTGPLDPMQEPETGRTLIDKRVVYYQDSGPGMKRSNILHEMAHVILLDTLGFAAFQAPTFVQGHGVEFASVYVTLVKNFLPSQAPALVQAFNQMDVQYKELA